MKKITAGILAFGMIISICSGCSEGDDKKSVLVTSEFKPISVDDIKKIDWFVEEAVIENNNIISFNYTNNSSYTITDVEMKFSLKDDVTPQQLEVFKDEVDDVSDVYILGYNRKFAKSGETVKNSPCTINGTFNLVEKMEQFNLTEPSSADISYIGADQKMHAVSYDYKTEKLKENSKVLEPHEWSDTDISKMIPTTESEYIYVTTDDSDKFRFKAFDCKKEQFDSYVKECKNKGFVNDQSNKETSYSAKNVNGYELTVRYDGIEETMSVEIEKE